jgi:oxygen-independent coproporphyrinogen-3 oxidase
MVEFFTRRIRQHFSGRHSRYEFLSAAEPSPSSWPGQTDLYLHVPFCQNFCPHCPYYKERYEPKLVAPFIAAVRRECRLWANRLGRCRVNSLYIGGGTPLLLGERLVEAIDAIREQFKVEGPVAIELSPSDITEDAVAWLRKANVGMVSLGVQSFSEENLRLIGRNYGPATVSSSIERLMDGRFDVVNLDLMFALPGQRLDSLRFDMDNALASLAHQFTFYPLFTFPHTPAGRARSLTRLQMPNLHQRRLQYRCLHETMAHAGLRRVSVWGFARPGATRYSSVTRESYVGLGPGAASCLPGQFLFNTFSWEHYQQRLLKNQFATSL